MRTVVITGANRGIGLALTRHYAAAGDHVVATCRVPNRAKELQALGVEIHALDVASDISATAFGYAFAERNIDILLNNAGVLPEPSATALTADLGLWSDAFEINAIGPARITRALIGPLTAAPAGRGTTLGSLAGIYRFISVPKRVIYNSTKAAAHAVTISFGKELAQYGVVYIGFRPGTTTSSMTRFNGKHDASDSAAKIATVLDAATLDDAGMFIDRKGFRFPYHGNIEFEP